MGTYWSLSGRGRGGCLLEAGSLLTFSAFRMSGYSSWALIRGWVLIPINTVLSSFFKIFFSEGFDLYHRNLTFFKNYTKAFEVISRSCPAPQMFWVIRTLCQMLSRINNFDDLSRVSKYFQTKPVVFQYFSRRDLILSSGKIFIILFGSLGGFTGFQHDVLICRCWHYPS